MGGNPAGTPTDKHARLMVAGFTRTHPPVTVGIAKKSKGGTRVTASSRQRAGRIANAMSAVKRGRSGGSRQTRAALLAAGTVLLVLSLPGSIDTPASPRADDAVERVTADDNPQVQPPAPGDEDSPVAGAQEPAAPDAKPDSGKGKGGEDGDGASEAQGSIHETVDVEPGEIADPVAIDETAEFGNGVEARLSSIESIEAEAFLPGEFSGPAVVVTVEVSNGSSETINLDTVTVDLVRGNNLSADPVTDPERTRLSGDLGAGETTSGDYVFTLAPDEREDVQVRIKYAAETPTVVFAGSVADG